jgi:hypothetical protein
MTQNKTASNAIHGAPAPNEEPAMEGAPPTKSDHISLKAKLMAELVTEQRKWVYSLNMELVKTINDNDVSISKFQSTITARDRSIANKEVEIAKQKAVVETCKAKLGAEEASHQSKILQLRLKQDAALAVLNNQLESNWRDNKGDKAKSLNIGCKLASTTDRLQKLMSDVTKLCLDYDKLATQHCESKSENSRTKKKEGTRPDGAS